MKKLDTPHQAGLKGAARRPWLATVFAGAAVLAVPGAVHAQEQRRVAVVSALGDSITVAQSEPTTGSHLKGRRVDDVFRVPEGVFDVHALGVMQKGLSGANVLVIPLKLKSASVLGDADRLTDGDRWIGSDMLNQALTELKATHLVLLRPLRAPAQVQLAQITMGQGHLRGLGFYLDRNTTVRTQSEAIAARRGFLAPFVYAELSMVDMAQRAVTASSPIRFAEAMTTNSEAGAGDAWDLLSTQQKIETLRAILQEQIARQLPVITAGLGSHGTSPASANAGAGGESSTRVRP